MRNLILALVSASVLWITYGIFYPLLGQRVDFFLQDLFTRIQLQSHAPENILIVDIDDESLAQVAPWPWPRGITAALLHKITAAGALGVGVDIVFPEKTTQEEDRLLVKVFSEDKVCGAQAFDLMTKQPREIGRLAQGIVPAPSESVKAHGYVGNFDQLAHAMRCVGHITPWVDADGVVRRIPVWIKYKNRAWPYLAAAMLNQKQFSSSKPFHIIPYRINPNAWQSISAYKVLTNQVSADLLKGKWVLIGSTALGLSDKVTTPINPWLPGVVLHAELLDGLLRPVPKPIFTNLIYFSWLSWLAGVLLILVLAQTRQFKHLFMGFILLGLVWGVISYLQWQAREPFPISLPWLGWLVLLQLIVFSEWRTALKSQRRFVSLFSQYLAPSVVKTLISRQLAQTALQPEMRHITVMFADIVGFTQVAKSMSAEQLASLTREILEIMTAEIHHYEGTLDKYIGDAVMAFWNAPVDQPQHEQKAVRCAQGILRALETWNQKNPHLPEIKVHIGVHTGEAMVGDLGTSLRHTYTAIGHTVNVAERIMRHATAQCPIVISKQLAAVLEQEGQATLLKHVRILEID